MGWLRWVAFGVLATAAILSLGLDAAGVPEASHAVDVVVEQVVVPQLEREWENGPVWRSRRLGDRGMGRPPGKAD